MRTKRFASVGRAEIRVDDELAAVVCSQGSVFVFLQRHLPSLCQRYCARTAQATPDAYVVHVLAATERRHP